MKEKMKRIVCMLLVTLMLLTSVPVGGLGLEASAATTISYSPNPKVEYSYSSGVTTGTIRYISQTKSSTYFSSNYWGNWSNQAGSECGTASISMALSYIGVNKTPQTILDTNNGTTYFTGWGVETSSPSISTGMNNYIIGNGKYSPLIVHFTKGYDPTWGHWVVLIGKISENSYLVLDPGSSSTWTLTTSDYRYVSIDRTYQYYNPNASINNLITTTYPSYCKIKVTASTTYIKSLPCSEGTDKNSKTLETASKNATYLTYELVKNKAGNLWYKVKTASGATGYMYSGDTSYVSYQNDITSSGITVPASHTVGKSYVLTGSVGTTYTELKNVSAYIYKGSATSGTAETGTSVSASGKSYSFKGSTIDNQTKFNVLPVGTHTFVVKATCSNYYAKSGTTVQGVAVTYTMYKNSFEVVNAGSTNKDTQKPTISNIKVSNLSSSGYTVTCNVSDNVKVTRVAFPTWTHNNGQDDLFWRDGTISGNTVTFKVNASEHKNESGWYATHIYAYDAAGNSVVATKDVLVPVDDIISVDDSAKINNNHYLNTEQLKFQGWAFSNKGKKVSFKYVLDSKAAVSVTNEKREDVKKAYPNTCSFTDVGYSFTLDLSKLSAGKHTMNVIATSSSGVTKTVSNLCFYVDAHSHNSNTIIPAVSATCTTTGLTEGKKCSVCGTVTVAQQVIEANGHTLTIVKGETATCTTTGLTEGEKCSTCGIVTVEQQIVEKKSHTYEDVINKATLTVDGKIETKCSVCGDMKLSTIIYYPADITLSETSFVYNGNVQGPAVIVKDSNNKELKLDTDYSVEYEGNLKEVGKYAVTINFKGNYSGSETLYFTIKPQATSKVTTTQSSSAIKLIWDAVEGADGYRVYMYDTSAKKWVNKKTLTATNYTVSKLNANTTYQFKIIAYKKSGDSVIWGDYSAVIKATTKLAAPNGIETAYSTSAIKLTWDAVEGADGYRVYMYDTATQKWVNKKTLTATSLTVKNLMFNTTYQFKVIAYKKVNGTAIWGDYSPTIKATTKLPAPTGIKIAQNESAIKLTWNKVAGADGYRVYMYNASTKKWVNQKTLTATSLMIKNLKAGTTYQFKIIAYKKVNGTAVWGDYTAAFKASTRTATPKITAVASTAKKRVAVAWSDVAGETGYELWASTKKDSGYKKVVTAKANITKGVRTDFTSGKTYYFKVRAYRTVGNTVVYSAWSAAKALKVK